MPALQRLLDAASRRVQPAVWLSLWACLVLCVIPGYFLKFPLPEFSAKIIALLESLAFALGLTATGRLTCRLILGTDPGKRGETSLLARLPLYLGIGAGMVGGLIAVLGWAIPGSLALKMKLLIVALVFVTAEEGFDRFRSGSGLRAPSFQLGSAELLCLAIALAGAAAAFAACFTPITYYDSLVYHMALPELYSRLDRIVAVPENLYSYFPASIEMLFLFSINRLSQPDYVVNLLGWTFSAAASMSAFAWAREIGGGRQAAVALALWWTMPAALLLTSGGYVDVPLGLTVLLAVRCFELARRRQWDTRWLILSGLCAGFACSIKYTGAICAIVLFAVLLFSLRRVGVARIGIFCAAAALPFSVWLARNALTIGNPVFPFFFDRFGGAAGWTRETAQGYFQLLVEYQAASNVFIELIRAPWSLTQSAMRHGGGFDVLGDFGWPLILFGAPLAFFLRRKGGVGFLSLYIGFHFAAWMATKPVLRFLVASLPLAVIAASAGIDAVWKRGAAARIALGVLAMPWLLSNLTMAAVIWKEIEPFNVPFGIERRNDYLERKLTSHAPFRWLNENLGAGEKVALVAEQRTYRLLAPFVASNFFAPSLMGRWASGSDGVSGLISELKRHGVTHILVNHGELSRMGGWSRFAFTSDGEANFNALIKDHAELIGDDRNVRIFKLLFN